MIEGNFLFPVHSKFNLKSGPAIGGKDLKTGNNEGAGLDF